MNSLKISPQTAIQMLSPLGGLDNTERDFVHKVAARPNRLSEGDRRVITAIYNKHFGVKRSK